MYIKKKHQKNTIQILFTLSFLWSFSFFILAAEKFNVEPRTQQVNAAFFEIKDWKSSWMIDLNNIIIADENYDRFTYVVQAWDNLTSIAYKFWTTVSTIKKVNNLKSDSLKSNQKLLITQEEWILYNVASNTTLEGFSKKYNLDIEKLKELNYITDSSQSLESGDELFLPISQETAMNIWLIQRPQVATTPKTATKSTGSKSATKNNVPDYNNTPTQSFDWKSIIAKWYYKPNVSNWFVQGHCTWYVAAKLFPYSTATKQKRLWSWNGKDWYANAKAAGYDVWSSPTKGSIVVMKNGGGSYYAYGHVWIVLDIDKKNNKILIEDMNAVWRFVVTQRWVSMNSSIIWYIYL